MTVPLRPVDRRAALKERHRTAIVDAADALIRERRSSRFSVDELAARADVSRRTVFNHFTSLDDVVVTACTRELAVVIETFQARVGTTPGGDGSPASLFADVAGALRSTDLPPAVAYLYHGLDELTDGDAHGERIVQDVFARVSARLVDAVRDRDADVDRFEVEMLISSLLHGTALVAGHWVDETGAALDDASRARWDALLDRLLRTTERGWGPGATTLATGATTGATTTGASSAGDATGASGPRTA